MLSYSPITPFLFLLLSPLFFTWLLFRTFSPSLLPETLNPPYKIIKSQPILILYYIQHFQGSSGCAWLLQISFCLLISVVTHGVADTSLRDSLRRKVLYRVGGSEGNGQGEETLVQLALP